MQPTTDASGIFDFATLRAGAAKVYPYFSPMLYSLIPIPVEGFMAMNPGGWAVDEFGRIYYDPILLSDPAVRDEWMREEKKDPYRCLIACTIHEMGHPLRFHRARYEALPLTPVNILGAIKMQKVSPRAWNMAADAELNDDPFLSYNLPSWAIFPSTLGMPNGLTAEEYLKACKEPPPPPPPPCKTQCPSCGAPASKLRIRALTPPVPGRGIIECTACGYEEEIELQPGGGGEGEPIESDLPPEERDGEEGGEGEEGDGDSQGWDDGSGVGGKERPWELGPPTKENPGLSKPKQEEIRREVAKEIQEHAKRIGNVPGSWKAWADEELSPPLVDWRDQTRAFLHMSIERTVGAHDFTFRRPSRRRIPGLILPSTFRPKLEIAIVVDTSASMDGDDKKAALSELDGIILETQASVRYLCCDTESRDAHVVTSAQEVVWEGGGGTDMMDGVRNAAELHPVPHIIVVLTDGYTYWDREREVEPEVIVALVGNSADISSVPSWAHGVKAEV